MSAPELPTLTWMLTSEAWPNARWPRGPDFTAFDGELLVGRVYQYEHGPEKGLWFWTMSVERPGPPFPGPTHGVEARQGDAGRCVVEAYGALLKHVDAHSPHKDGKKPAQTKKGKRRRRSHHRS